MRENGKRDNIINFPKSKALPKPVFVSGVTADIIQRPERHTDKGGALFLEEQYVELENLVLLLKGKQTHLKGIVATFPIHTGVYSDEAQDLGTIERLLGETEDALVLYEPIHHLAALAIAEQADEAPREEDNQEFMQTAGRLQILRAKTYEKVSRIH